MIRPMLPSDWLAVRDIYADGIRYGHATFQLTPYTQGEWDAGHLEAHRLVFEEGGVVLGWAALSRTSTRPVYAGVAEVSLYVAEAARGRGVGRALLDALVASAEQGGIWTLQAGIFPENTVSLALHHRAGFRTVGVRERIGQMHGQWRDVVLLERRSSRAGT